MKKVGVVGTYGHVKNFPFMSTDALLNKVGQNTGNLLFQYAVCNSIDEDIIVIGENEDLGWDIEKIKEQCRILVIPSANFIRENFDFSGFVDFLEATGLPLVFIGLGAQAKDYSQTQFEYHPSIYKLFDLLKNRCELTGLRGEFTQKILARHGVDTTIITGCPTNFLNKDVDLPKILESKWNQGIYSFISTGDEPWPKDQAKKDAERQMISWVNKRNGIYVQQSVAPFIKYMRRNNSYQTEEVPSHHEESLKKSLAPEMSNEEFRAFVATKVRVFYSVEQWLEDASRFDFSIGLRLHGNMVAWQSGTPAIWIYHDARTRELAETMALPHISHQEFLNMESLEELRSHVDFSFEKYQQVRALLRLNLASVFQKNDIKHKLF
jgi:hypothetical protein